MSVIPMQPVSTTGARNLPVPVVSKRRYRWLVVRAWLVRATRSTGRAMGIAWRYLVVLWCLNQCRRVWPDTCAGAKLAKQRVHFDQGKETVHTYAVPRLQFTRVDERGFTALIRMRPGQVPEDFTTKVPAIRHAFRAQSVRVVELPQYPGMLQARVLRRDPLDRVFTRAYALAADRFVIGMREDGDPAQVDFGQFPHLLMAGTSGSGKSVLLSNLFAGIAPTDAMIHMIDCKFELEAEIWRERASSVISNRMAAYELLRELYSRAERRAGILKAIGSTSVANAEATHGVHFQRVFLAIDEIAELVTSRSGERIGGDEKGRGAIPLAEATITELISCVQLLRALGMHVIVCGQRFSSDLGKGVTTIREQLAMRIVMKVESPETAQMSLNNAPKEMQELPLKLHRKGAGILAQGEDIVQIRCANLTEDERRAIAHRHADKAITWADLAAADDAILQQVTARRWAA